MSVGEPLAVSEKQSIEIRRGVGRLQNGARELLVIALVMPLFLAGAELAAEGFNASGTILRDGIQRPFDRTVFAVFEALLVLLALRSQIVSARAARVLADALSENPDVRAGARERLVRLAGPAPIRRASDWIAIQRGRLLLAVVFVLIVSSALHTMPNPIWLAVLGTIAVAADVRWRAMVADAAGQIAS